MKSVSNSPEVVDAGSSEATPSDSSSPAQRAATLKMRSDLHRVGAGLSVRFAFNAGQLDADWRPRAPTYCEWRRVGSRYRDARHAFLQHLSARIGGTVVCVEAKP